MTFTEQQVEQIVVEVIRRLGMLGVAGDEHRLTPANPNGQLILSDRVVTMRLIEGRLAGVERVVVQPRAVITPAVQDELKQRRVELVREEQT
jgi:hypothetical protein